MKKCWLILLALTAVFSLRSANNDDDLEDFKKSVWDEMDAFQEETQNEMNSFRDQINKEMSEWLGRPWEMSPLEQPVAPPPDPEPDPIILDDDDREKIVTPKPVVIKDIITPPKPQPRPQPVEPIREIPMPKPLPSVAVTFYGTEFKVRGVDLGNFSVGGTKEENISRAWLQLSASVTNNLIRDCLAIRADYRLCDWAYLNLLERIAQKIADGRKVETTVLTAFLFSQSGYKMRLARDQIGNLILMYAAESIVYKVRFITDGNTRFYAFHPPYGDELYICAYNMPGEKNLDFNITQNMKLAYSASDVRSITAKFVPELTVDVWVNKNLIDFYNDYPDMTGSLNPYTKWAVYANVPPSEEIRRYLYPKVREVIAGKSQADAANILLHLAQTFDYGYDSEIWGGDRAFFMDETWFYPLSDCEDHAIHYSRLVRDLLGLDVVLVFYPGHLASAVAFTDPSIKGDWIEHRGKRFTVCDPTIFYSNIGETMTDMDNSNAILIDLQP